ncbi:hypothetical protein [Epilithonimonas sp.]|uniref:putative polyvalent protein kinase domain-containing protein n=1 Tax=Epilithonimonas sp. TaxID=2894511 RepID=UPI0035B3CC1B
MEEITRKLREGIEAAKRKCEGQTLTLHQQEDLEKQITYLFAKENSLWIENLYTLGKPTDVAGYENTLALDDINGIVYKSNNLFNSGFLVSNFFRQINIHNSLFPETRYEFVGVTGFDNGQGRTPYIEIIIKQDFVYNAVQATAQEIEEFMLAIGFEKINDSIFTNGKITISDLHPRNVLKDENGIIYVVDDILSENPEH